MSRARRQLRDYGPIQLADRLGLARWQVDRALGDDLIPRPDVHGGRWSARVVEDACARVDDIRAAVGSVPDVPDGCPPYGCPAERRPRHDQVDDPSEAAVCVLRREDDGG